MAWKAPGWLWRTLRHIAFFALGSAIIQLVFEIGSHDDATDLMSMGAAYAGLFFLVAALMEGPWRVLTNRETPLSSYLRRDLGIWAGVFGLLHVYVGFLVYFDTQFVPYFFHISEGGDIAGVRLDLFGLANYVGLMATLIVIALLTVSNDWSIRKLKAVKWKKIQRWSYAAGVLTVAHGFLYQAYEGRIALYVGILIVATLLPLSLQFLGWHKRTQSGMGKGVLE